MAGKKRTTPTVRPPIDVPIFGAFCEIIQGEEVARAAQEVVTHSLGTSRFTPVHHSGAIILSQRELFGSVQWGPTEVRQARYDRLVQGFTQDTDRIKSQDSPGLSLGKLHVIAHPHANPNQGTSGANRLFVAAQMYRKDRAESPALRMRSAVTTLLDQATYGHNQPPATADIQQPLIVLGEYFGSGTSITAEANRALQDDMFALGTLTVGPLVRVEGFDPQALARIPS